MPRKTSFATRVLPHAALVLGLMGNGPWAQTAPTADALQAFDAAMTAYEHNHWDRAYAAFTRLADRGHPEAARIALQMRRHGPALYGMAFNANAQQIARWQRLSACGAEPSGSACLQALRLP